jgi:lipoyl(octanoyl) transferase
MASSVLTSPRARPTILRTDHRPALWRDLPGLTSYDVAHAAMIAAQAQLVAGEGREQVWVLESPAGHTRGSQARDEDGPGSGGPLIEGLGVRPPHGSWFYHGPGVIEVVLLLDLRGRLKSVPALVFAVHEFLLTALRAVGAGASLGEDGCDGIFVGDQKVAAVALGLQQWVTRYGALVYVAPDLPALSFRNPCGTLAGSVTSLQAVGVNVSRADVTAALRSSFHAVFGPTSLAAGVLP